MASEGLDIPSLNTLIMTTPRREVEQSIGRIQRKAHELTPKIYDIIDNCNLDIKYIYLSIRGVILADYGYLGEWSS